MKPKFLSHRLKIIIISSFVSILFLIILVVGMIKILNPFKVSIYNYESYLDKKIVNKIKSNYSYHTFTNLDEFTKAIKNKKTVAGVSSDYQIAQLILENKIKKINFQKVFNLNPKDINEEKIMSLYSNDVKQQFKYFDKWIINKIKKINNKNEANKLDENNNVMPFIYYKDDSPIGFEIDGRPGIDKFYEFLIPYFTLDKTIVFNTENSNIFKNTRNNKKDNIDFEDIKNGMTWKNTISLLVSKYKKPKIYWTNWFQDNIMIGQFYKYESGDFSQLNNDSTWKLVDKENYKNIVNSFSEFVITTTNESIKNSNVNRLITDGQELVSSIIEPHSGKADIAIMYNGDALDAYYGKDNFSQLNEKDNISFVRPKHNYKNIDAWIISKDTDNYNSDILLERLSKIVFSDVTLNLEEIEKEYIMNVFNLLMEQDKTKEDYYLSQLFIKKENNLQNTVIKDISNLDINFFNKNFSIFRKAFEKDNLSTIMNFNTINYTPSYQTIKSFLKKWYFLDNKKIKDNKAISIFDLEVENGIKYRAYQPLDLELRTKIIDWYYQKTKS